MSADNCEQCGMPALLQPPPALLDANKVCVGESRGAAAMTTWTRACARGIARRVPGGVPADGALRDGLLLHRRARGLVRPLPQPPPLWATGLASTRVYAVSRRRAAGAARRRLQGPKHFSIIEDPSPPPPPAAAEAAGRPPPPLPATLGMAHTETHIECTFLDGMDFRWRRGRRRARRSTTAETQKHCCNKCGLQPGCTDFVYEPASKTCVLLPHVPTAELVKTPNPSTVAGTVSISHVSNFHASCEFEVGSGYAGGSLGAAEPLTKGMTIATQQERCAASARPCPALTRLSRPRLPAAGLPTRASATPTARNLCAKYSGDCQVRVPATLLPCQAARAPSPRSDAYLPFLAVQLFASFAEHYYTFGLLSGIVTGRSALGDAGDSASIYAEKD